MRGKYWPILALCLVSGCGGCSDDTALAPDAEIETEIDADTTPDADTAAPTTTASPIGGVYRAMPEVTLTADEDATIYVTTDGSTPTTSSTSGASPFTVTGVVTATPVRFFAVDAAGNAEAPQSLTYTVDRLGPAAVAGFTATADGADIDLAWTNPDDASFDEVVIARVADAATADPATNVIYTGSAEVFTDTAPGAGHHTYVAWARHDTGELAEARTAGVRIEEAAQSFTITIDVTGGAATVTSQPTAWTLTIANYANAAGAISFDLTATSGLAGITFNPKLVVETISGGGAPAFDSQDGTVDLGAGDVEYQYFGPEGLLNGGGATRTILVSDGGSTSITISGQIVDDVGAFYSAWDDTGAAGIVDARTLTAWPGMPAPGRRSATVDANDNVQWSTMLASPDGRYVYAASRSGPRIAKIDTTTFATVGGLDVAVTRASASAGRIVLDPSGKRLYVAVNDGSHGGARIDNLAPDNSTLADVDAIVVEVDAATMTETSRISVSSAGSYDRLARIALSPDGRTLAAMVGAARVAVSNMVLHLYDVSTWSERDADAGTAGAQTVPLGVVRGPNMAFDATSRYLLVGQAGRAPAPDLLTFGVVDLTTMALTTYTSAVRLIGASRIGDTLFVDADYASTDHVSTIDLATGVMTPLSSPRGVAADFVGATARGHDGRLYASTASGFRILDGATGAIVDSGVYPQDQHSIALTP